MHFHYLNRLNRLQQTRNSLVEQICSQYGDYHHEDCDAYEIE